MLRTALVTGANRGLGLETARQLARLGLRVLLTARSEEKAERAARVLHDEGLEVVPYEVDVASDASCVRLAELGAVDILVNNAGILPERDETLRAGAALDHDALDVPSALLRAAFETNTLGAYRCTQALVPGMRDRGYGRVVNVSSGMGQLADMYGGYPAYRVSKAGLNALTRIFAYELRGTGVLVNAVCPGWIKTDMGGPGARLELDEGVGTIVWAATLPEDGPTGGFFRYKQPIDW